MEENEEVRKTSKKQKEPFSIRLIVVIIAVIAIIIISVVLINSSKSDTTEEDTSGEVATVEGEENVEEVEEYVTVLDSGAKLNTSEVLSEKKTLNGLEVTNTQLTYANGIATLLATVTNTTDEKIEQKNVNVDILDAEGNTLMTLHGLIDPVDAGASVQLNMNVSADIANAYDFTIYE